jgi:hypothetical protein
MALTGFAFVILLAVSPISEAVAEESSLLSASDYVFLDTQNVRSTDAILKKMSPKELRRLHYVINDARTEKSPNSRAQAVMDALGEFEGHQRWETDNPGHLWDEKKPQAAAR